MKQVAQNYRSGELAVIDAPAPSCHPGGVLVRTQASLISAGTELMKVNEARMSLLGKARSRPDQLRKVMDTVAQQGVRSAYTKAMRRLDSYTPLGYSLAGEVMEVGTGVEGLKVGQTVACAGNEHALHAEVNWVPFNLCVPVPAGVPPRSAAFAAVGAIAMHGVRQAEVQLGDTACVIGLGLVGQLVVQLLAASGARVVGIDVVADRCRLAEKLGASVCAGPDPRGLAQIRRVLADMTDGLGADRIFLVAGGASNQPVETAALLARDRARVIDIGKVSLNLPWNAYYDKELDVRFSRSYGPGRYDDLYELGGVDYPAGYVRWTERRNLRCFLDLIANGALDIEPLVSGVFPVEEAASVYEHLRTGELPGVGFLFEYGPPERASEVEADATRLALGVEAPPDQVEERGDGDTVGRAGGKLGTTPPKVATGPPPRPRASGDTVRIGFVGAGNYASSVLLPALVELEGASLHHLATNTSLSAANAERRFGFGRISTSADAVFDDADVDAVFIVTRHHTHADLVCRALEAGKSVFVEKPLALGVDELARILDTVDATGNDRLLVGFNRRFSPILCDLRHRFGRCAGDVYARYVVNAGELDASSWYLDDRLEGSRFTGEGGHFIDTISWWLDDEPAEVQATQGSSPGAAHAVLRYVGGAVATIDYVTTGNQRYPKECLEVSSAQRTARLDNFKSASLWAGRRATTSRSWKGIDKGQRGLTAAFVDAVRGGGPMPIPLASLVATTRATLAVSDSMRTAAIVRL